MEPPPPGPPDAPPPAPPAPAPGLCPRCGAPHDAYQEYCLECGARLPAAAAPAGYTTTREIWGPSPVWRWAVLLALLLLALALGALVVWAAMRDEEPQGRPIVTTGPGTTESIGVITDTSPTTLEGTTTVEVPTNPTITIETLTTPTATATTTAPTTGVISWPANTNGFTTVLASIPTTRGRPAADAKAQEAIGNGLSEVGVLNSADYISLNPGYYVVFSGVHTTRAQAESALATVRSSGYPLAYVREITP